MITYTKLGSSLPEPTCDTIGRYLLGLFPTKHEAIGSVALCHSGTIMSQSTKLQISVCKCIHARHYSRKTPKSSVAINYFKLLYCLLANQWRVFEICHQRCCCGSQCRILRYLISSVDGCLSMLFSHFFSFMQIPRQLQAVKHFVI